jgi:hypothetical protein
MYPLFGELDTLEVVNFFTFVNNGLAFKKIELIYSIIST